MILSTHTLGDESSDLIFDIIYIVRQHMRVRGTLNDIFQRARSHVLSDH